MCNYCSQVKELEIFSPKDYEQTIEYIKELINKEGFIFVEGTCAVGEQKKNGLWVADVIHHIIKCPQCGQEFICAVNTYRGGGSLKKRS